MTQRVNKQAFAVDLAEINSVTLQLLANRPEVFDAAARGALVALAAAIEAVKGHSAMMQMFEAALIP
jgi:hypothetical protein